MVQKFSQQPMLRTTRMSSAVNDMFEAPQRQRQSGVSRWLSGSVLAGLALSATLAGAATPEAAAEAPGAASAASAASVTSAAPAPAAEAHNDVTQLESVTVTADKRVERAIDVPVSVATVSGKAMLEQHKASIGDYLSGIPGVSVASGATKNDINVRGMTTGGVANPTVAVVIDDVPAGSSTLSAEGGSIVPNLDPSDIQNIEVLRGPQGTLYGASSIGGLIKYTTVDPDVTKFGGSVQVDGSAVAHGGLGHAERAAINIPLVPDTAAIRISAYDRWDPGFTRNVNDGTTDNGAVRTQGGRIAGLFFLNDKWTVRSSLLYQATRVMGSGGEDWNSANQAIYGNYANSRIPGTYQSRDYMLFTTSVTGDLGWGVLTSTTGFSDGRYGLGLDMTPSFGQIASLVGLKGYGALLTQRTYTEKFTQELRLESPQDGRKLEWRLGAFFTNEVSDNNQQINFAQYSTGVLLPGGLITGQNLDSRYRELAGFGSLRYHFTSRFDVEVGIRYAANHQTFVQTGASASNSSSSDGTFAYSFSPRFRLTPDWMVYGRIANGYRPGGANTVTNPALPSTYGPDKSVNYELGTKGELLGRRLSFDVSVYHVTWSGIQLSAIDPVSSLGYTINSGGAKSDGLEASLSAKPWAGMTMTASLGYTRAVLTTDTPNSIYGRAGDRLPYSPKWLASYSLRQTYALPGGFKGFSSAIFTFVGDREQAFTPSATTRRLDAGAYATLDLQTGASRDGWTAVLYVRNLFDRRGVNTLGYQDQLTYRPFYGASLITPRTIGVSLAKSF